jgi:hypothetical protein
MPKKTQTVMLMAAIIRTFIFAVFAVAPLCSSAASPYPQVDICELLRNLDHFEGKTIELHSDVKFTMHGRHLLGRECRELGSLALSINDPLNDDKTVVDFVRGVMSQHAEATVVLVGRPNTKPTDGWKPSESYVGDFILEKVVGITGP